MNKKLTTFCQKIMAAASVMVLTVLSSCSTGEQSKNSDRNAEPITVNVAIVFEDPKLPGTDTYMHDFFKWNNPRELAKAYADTLNSVTHGAVKYNVVEIQDDTTMFTRLIGDKDLLKYTQVIDYLKEPGWKTLRERNTKYDYKAMLQHYGYDKKVDSHEIDEVWVFSWPYSGMSESQFSGKDAFWLNSVPIENPTNTRLLPIMGLNYERDLNCAMESYGHRIESVIWHLYGRWDSKITDLNKKNTWELFITIDKDCPEKAQVGCIHFPPNGLKDYDFINKTKVLSWADEWYNYPNVDLNAEPKLMNCENWQNSHVGYMCWWFRHIPHFKGIDPKDQYLNNWWHYVVDWDEAKKLETKLRSEAKHN